MFEKKDGNILVCCVVLLGIILFFCATSRAQTLAFPGALGFGANVTGGRGGTVYHVTTLADSGAGSFRDAVSHSRRIIIFDVGGYIKLNSAVSCSGDLTIAGQTAPGGGIGFYGGEISFSDRSNIICRYIRIRPGSLTTSSTDDALALADARTMIFDHCSFEFGPWNNIDAVSGDWQTTPVTEITFQNCLDADPTGQQFGAHTESVSSTMSWFYNIFANSHNRNPLSKINDVFINNVLYNCAAGYTTHTSTKFSHDIVNNYFITGPATGGSSDFPWFQVDDNQSIYYSGNLFDSNSDGALNGSITTPYWYQGGTGTILSSPWSPVTTSVPTFSTAGAYRYAISAAGTLPRDQMDNLVVSQVKTLGNGTTGTGAGTVGPDGGLYTSQSQTGLGNNGYGVINGGIPATDSDGDGMPDFWELTVGLNPYADDAMTIAADGYANIEHYLNWLADPHAQTATNTSVDVDLWNYTSGFTNASPVYSVNNASNGVVTLTGGHVAHFAPNVNFYGLAGFQFSVLANDGSSYTNTVTVAVVPQSQSTTQPSNLTWVGDGVKNLWAVADGTNWFDGTNLVAFNSGDNVTFDDTGTNTPAIDLSGSLAAGTVYVIADQDYTFSGGGFLAGPTALFKTGNGALILDTTNNFTGGTTINDGTIQVGDGANFSGNLVGNITNNGALIFDNLGDVSSSASISGSGAFTKNGAGALTLTGAQTYTNLTTINAGALQFSGTLPAGDITNNSSLLFAPSASQIFSNTISGSGNLTINVSGILTLSGANTYSGDTTNNGGFLVLSNNQAAGSGTIIYNGGAVVVAAGIVITNDFSIPSSTSDLSMMATNAGTAVWAGNIVNLGGGASWRPGSDGVTLMFTGTAEQGGRNFIIPRGTVHIASNAVVSATGSATAFGRDGSGNNRSANITVQDHAAVTLGACSMGGGKQGGSVTLTIQDNASLSTGANNFDLHNVNRSTAVNTVRLNGGTFTTGGFIKTRTYIAAFNFNGGILKAAQDNPSFLPALNNFTANIGVGGAIFDDGGFAIGIGASLVHDPTLGVTPDGGLTKLGAGTLSFSAPQTYTGPTIISDGVLALASIGSIADSASIFIASGATLDVGGLSELTLANNQILSGNGLISGNLVVGGGAILSPGDNTVGALTFSNSLTLAPGSTNIFEVSHLPLASDSVEIFGALTNGGTLIITNLGAAPLAAGDSFQLLNAASYNGAFSSVILPPLSAGLRWNTNNLNTSGALSIITATVPVVRSTSLSSGGLVLSGTGGAAGANYVLLTSTNLVLPLNLWTPLLTNQFDSNGNFNFTNAIDAAAPQSFYLLQMQ
ncbi:MAG: autotransporter-associated beta strand repeat-containing protein [Limisphaerales bacterium]